MLGWLVFALGAWLASFALRDPVWVVARRRLQGAIAVIAPFTAAFLIAPGFGLSGNAGSSGGAATVLLIRSEETGSRPGGAGGAGGTAVLATQTPGAAGRSAGGGGTGGTGGSASWFGQPFVFPFVPPGGPGGNGLVVITW